MQAYSVRSWQYWQKCLPSDLFMEDVKERALQHYHKHPNEESLRYTGIITPFGFPSMNSEHG
jgi:hypothetical protein